MSLPAIQRWLHLRVWLDESQRPPFFGLGGFYVKEPIRPLVQAWRQMNASPGLPPKAEIKWTLGQKSATAAELRRVGKSIDDLRNICVKAIARMNSIVAVCVVMQDRRKPVWQWIRPTKPSPVDLYCPALRFILQRVAEEAVIAHATAVTVVADVPPLRGRAQRVGTLRQGTTAALEEYAEGFRHGVGKGPCRRHGSRPLARLGFEPSLLYGDPTYHDMLQIADCIVGLMTEWVKQVHAGRPTRITRQRVVTIQQRLRARCGANGTFWGDGFVLWPQDDQLIQRLQSSLQGVTRLP